MNVVLSQTMLNQSSKLQNRSLLFPACGPLPLMIKHLTEKSLKKLQGF